MINGKRHKVEKEVTSEKNYLKRKIWDVENLPKKEGIKRGTTQVSRR